jgi:hypothetical protein
MAHLNVHVELMIFVIVLIAGRFANLAPSIAFIFILLLIVVMMVMIVFVMWRMVSSIQGILLVVIVEGTVVIFH